MGPVDFLIIGILVVIVGGAVYAMYRSRKKGKKCIGCPDSCACSGCSGACSGCNGSCNK